MLLAYVISRQFSFFARYLIAHSPATPQRAEDSVAAALCKFLLCCVVVRNNF